MQRDDLTGQVKNITKLFIVWSHNKSHLIRARLRGHILKGSCRQGVHNDLQKYQAKYKFLKTVKLTTSRPLISKNSQQRAL